MGIQKSIQYLFLLVGVLVSPNAGIGYRGKIRTRLFVWMQRIFYFHRHCIHFRIIYAYRAFVSNHCRFIAAFIGVSVEVQCQKASAGEIQDAARQNTDFY